MPSEKIFSPYILRKIWSSARKLYVYDNFRSSDYNNIRAYLPYFRIHVVAGTVPTPMDWSDPIWQAAKKTFLANMQYAADECSKVRTIEKMYVCI